MLTRTSSSRVPRAALAVGSRRLFSVPSWATVDPNTMSASSPGIGQNLVGGKWVGAAKVKEIPDPLNGGTMMKVPDTAVAEVNEYIERMKNCPRSGLHNPIKNPERYSMLGAVMADTAREMKKPEVAEFFARLIQRVVPKSMPQCTGEPTVARKFMENYSCDQVRFLAQSFGVPGDHAGQVSTGLRFPYGGVAVITPFNFPLEIPALQTLSALFMGNQPLTKVDWKVAIVMEQFVRMLHHCGLPKTDMDFLYSDGPVMNEILLKGDCRMTLFTGSQHVADKLAVDLKGKVKLEDAGFDWKVLGPDPSDVDYVVWQADQDAYAFSGQKCSAQSMLVAHEKWMGLGIVDKLRAQAAKRSLADLTISPVLTWPTPKILEHMNACLKLPGAELAFGGTPLTGHSIPDCYGAMPPTAVYVPIETIMASDANFALATTELFGPFQIITSYKEGQLALVIQMLNQMQNHLTAGVVSNDLQFIDEVLGNTITGTTYAGIRARTTAAPQQHWFGPSGDPRAGGIHTADAIKLCWSSHREVIYDHAPVASGWVGKIS